MGILFTKMILKQEPRKTAPHPIHGRMAFFGAFATVWHLVAVAKSVRGRDKQGVK
jgi:hypothetical protein